MGNSTRPRWAAIGAAVAVSLGAGGLGIAQATTDSADGPVSVFVPIEPCRLADNAAIGANASIVLAGWGPTGACDLPPGITALAANVTAVGATEQTNLRLYADGDDVPGTANLNPTPGAPPTPNAVDIPLDDATGRFGVYNRFGTVGVFIDVMGYYDDHTHDDRYYTEDEIDALPALPDAIVAFNADGTIRAGDEFVESAAYNSTFDRYEIDLAGVAFSINDDVAMVTPRAPAVTAGYNSAGGTTLLVFLADSDGNAIEAPFSVVVWDN